MKNRGVVAVFQKDRFDQYSNFTRIGDGSLGGKGRGLAFLDRMISKQREGLGKLLYIPKTLVLCTDIFDEFMDSNDLYGIALSDIDDDEILKAFLRGRMPQRLLSDLEAFMDVVRSPLAIRSSSLLEDSHYQPFAGIYSTYMIPYTEDKYERLSMLAKAIKAVYASVYYRGSKDYMTATSNVIDQEKMAVILQEVVGQQYGECFYPTFSGVARSVNYYPIGDEKAEEGTVSLAMGLGKYIVDGGTCLRVCPAHPHQVLQMSEMDIALRDTQTSFFALGQNDLEKPDPLVDDGFNLIKVSVRDADKDGSLQWICSTYNPVDQCIYDGYYEGRNRKIISFAGVLQNGVWPLPELLQLVLRMGQEEMQRPVEIEFACNLHPDKTGEFYLLQIRPMVDNRMNLGENLAAVPDEQCMIRSHNAIGHGIFSEIEDVVYVKTISDTKNPDYKYSPSNNPRIAEEIERINRLLLTQDRKCLLIGPGRWGSSDPWLGIPVKWPQISSAQVIVEAGLEHFQVEPSQGTHFFQNMTSFGVGYFTINPYRGDGWFDEDFLNKHEAEWESPLLKWVHFENPLVVKMDGKKSLGVIMKPAHTE